jgi:hypothetical protein
MILYYRYTLRGRLMDLFQQKKPEKSLRAREIKARVIELLRLNDEATVMVTELNCQDEDCPETETVIAVFRQGQAKIQATLHSSIEEIADHEIELFCWNAQNSFEKPEAPKGVSEETDQIL